MKINGNRGSSNAIGAKSAVHGASTPARDVAQAPTHLDKDLYIPSQEWLRLVAVFHQQPEIRQDRVLDVGRKLHQGYYLTAESDEQTAAAMLLAAA